MSGAGELAGGVLTFDQPVLCGRGGVRVDAVLTHTLAFPPLPDEGARIRLAMRAGGETYETRETTEYEHALRMLTGQLPGIELRVCGTCNLGAVGADGTDASGLHCYRPAPAALYAIGGPRDWVDAQRQSVLVQAWHHCAAWCPLTGEVYDRTPSAAVPLAP